MSRKLTVGVLAAAVAIAAVVFAGVAGSARSAAKVTQLPSSSCTPMVYKGSGTPDYIIASDLPLQGAIRHQTIEINRAIIWELQDKGWKAGSYKIGYQSCDDSTAQSGGWDTAKCATNAHLYASNRSVIGVVGTFNSGCAKIEIPILDRANPGPMAMVSPANTSPGITTTGPGADPGEPNKYYPTGVRNYARVVANDQYQGAADAMFSKSLGVKKVYVLNDKQTYGVGVASTYSGAAKKLGLTVLSNKGWDAKQTSYEALAQAIKKSGAQLVFLGGIVCNNGALLMKNIKAVNPHIILQMPDGFSDPNANGSVANGAYISVAGEPPNKLTGQGATFVSKFSKSIGEEANPYAAYGAEAADVLLRAIARSGGNRGNVSKALFGMSVSGSILGSFTINSQGDTSGASVTVYKQKGKNLVPVTTLTPPSSLVK
ncbi:MAG TPA: branched-chain amino acid ABC transporter substrate-binding protein [Gaiellaceae bacterium]|nr:branched-chain amino acid ABC transporter substrate-binding protein [Gaiellaceae bacterium]